MNCQHDRISGGTEIMAAGGCFSGNCKLRNRTTVKKAGGAKSASVSEIL
jgi:hypothetical protein